MSGPRFVPLTCPRCSGDLTGRAIDLVAYCRSCRTALRVDGERVAEIPAVAALGEPPGAGPEIRLPFWAAGTLATPAFQTTRPVTLTRIASRLLPQWPAQRGLEPPWPVGVRLPPESLARLATLARVQPPSTAPVLLGVPARLADRRIKLLAYEADLYPDDVPESAHFEHFAAKATAAR
jgi:hypothetical protein